MLTPEKLLGVSKALTLFQFLLEKPLIRYREKEDSLPVVNDLLKEWLHGLPGLTKKGVLLLWSPVSVPSLQLQPDQVLQLILPQMLLPTHL